MYTKKSFVFAAAILLLAACQSKEINIIQDDVKEEQEIEVKVPAPDITAVQEAWNSTKSTLEVDGEGVGTIYWTPADEINVFYGTTSTHYVSQNAVNATTAVFSTTDIIGISEGASENIWGLYPYNSSAICNGSAVTTTLPATQYGVAGTFDDDLYITLAHNNSTALTFYNVCGGIKFSLSRDDITEITFSGNNNEDIAGDISLAFSEGLPAVSVTAGEKGIILTPKAGGTFVSGEYYYIIALPGTLSGGFTMTFETDTEIGTFNYTAKAVTIKRSIFSKKDNIDSYAAFVSKPTLTNLSSAGTANCYMVNGAGDYQFDATVKGNSNESVGSPASVAVLWETFGTSTAPSVGDLVYSVSLDEGYVYFSATDAKGNALIAVKDSEGTILWSWHIWLVDEIDDDTFDEDDYNHYPAVGTLPSMMDRNLGATSKEVGSLGAYGLVYQWGRKDPFPGSSVAYTGSQSADVAAVSTTIREKGKDTIEGSKTEFAIKNPDCFIRVSTYTNYDNWGASSDAWGASKTIYDPCPVGYKMPVGRGPSGGSVDPVPVWFYSCFHLHAVYDSTNHGWLMPKSNGGNAWYPLCGVFPSSGFTYYNMSGNPHGGSFYPGNIGVYWTSTYDYYSGGGAKGVMGLYLDNTVSYEKDSSYGLKNICDGASVRCQKIE